MKNKITVFCCLLNLIFLNVLGMQEQPMGPITQLEANAAQLARFFAESAADECEHFAHVWLMHKYAKSKFLNNGENYRVCNAAITKQCREIFIARLKTLRG